MNNFFSWLKANWLPVGMGVLGVGGFAAMIYFSLSWSESLTTDLQAKLDNDSKALDKRANQVTYRIDPVGAGEEAVERAYAPNARMIVWFQEQRAAKAAAAKSVVDGLMTFNKGVRAQPGQMFLVERLFPAPAEGERFQAPRALARAVANEVPGKLLAVVRGGMPPPADQMLAELNDRRAQKVGALVAPGQTEKELTDEQRREIARDLVGFRVRRYQDRADQIGVYADASIFSGFSVPPGEPTLALCWDWQTAYWAAQDVMRAIAAANEPTRERGVPGAVVKRIEQLKVNPLPGLVTTREGGGPPGGALPGGMNDPAAAAPPDPNAAPLNPSESITGRQSGPGTGNGLYDVRKIDLTVIVSAADLPKLLDAIAKTNLMTVLDLDIAAVDPIEQLNQGFFYGTDPVVRATLNVESLWLREWTTPVMPPEVKAALGVPAPGATPPG